MVDAVIIIMLLGLYVGHTIEWEQKMSKLNKILKEVDRLKELNDG